MRLKSAIWVKAYLRRCQREGAVGVLVRRGDGERGAIYIKVSRLDGTATLYGPAPAGHTRAADEHCWQARDGGVRPEADVDALLEREIGFDPDLWVVCVEDRQGRHFLDGWLVGDGR
jgi:hypothetical protein